MTSAYLMSGKCGVVVEEHYKEEGGKVESNEKDLPVREPAVAGAFYDSGADKLRAEIERCFLSPLGPSRLPEVNQDGPRRLVGLVSPHAGLVYSGPTAAHGYARVAEDGLPDVAVLIGVNHRGYGAPVAVGTTPAWRTPLGDAEVDVETGRRIAELSGCAEVDESAHRLEHSLEVQVPFLQYIGEGRIRIVPVLLGIPVWDESALSVASDLGTAVAKAVEGQNALVIASTDFSHYESRQSAGRKDSEAIRRITELDERALVETVRALDISMCGVVPTAAAITACKQLGAVSARLLAYGDSGDVTWDTSQVVGYAAVELSR